MAKKTQNPNKKNAAQRKYIWKNLGLFVLAAAGILITFWPLFFISELRQYPECLAYDLFPSSNGYPSDSVNSFLCFIQIPMALVGIAVFSLAVNLLRNGKVVLRHFLKVTVLGALIVAAAAYLVLLSGFDLLGNTCEGYRVDQLPDFRLIIDSRR